MKYLAHDLGPQGIRVNAISAGPIRTLAAAGISNFKSMLHHAEGKPRSGGTSRRKKSERRPFYPLSDLASGVTGEIVYVDADTTRHGRVVSRIGLVSPPP